MLQRLHIQNYAIIEEIHIHFSSNLNIITGETGAGKSILIGALSMVLGERADTSVLLDKEKKCIIEGTFVTKLSQVTAFLQQNDLDAEEEIAIRREISTNGKSRAFINDTPVNLSQLKELSSLLVDLHQQFDTLEVGDSDFQRETIDALAGNAMELFRYQEEYRMYVASIKELHALRSAQSGVSKEFDYNKFLFDELEEANFSENEIEETESQIKLMSNAENIKSVLTDIILHLQDAEEPIVQRLKSLYNKLGSLNDFHSSIPALSLRLQSAQIELQDIAEEIDQLNNAVQYDNGKIDQLNTRMAEGFRLLKKHNVADTASLLLVKKQLGVSLQKITNLSEEIALREKEMMTHHSAAANLAEKISKRRSAQAAPFEEKVNELLTRVGMPNARIKTELKKSTELHIYGGETIEFLFNANLPAGKKAGASGFEPLRKVASGGELSRVMLSIKSLIAESIRLPTLIFDEIDSGISGEAAKQVASIMKGLSGKHQVISITHQPQIASKADTHFFVYKEIKEDRIVTAIKELNADERITTIAIMLSGERPTAAAFENAREMIGD